MALPILCLAISACSKPDAKAAADPNAPAVVRAPQPTLPGDIARKVDTAAAVGMLMAKSTTARNYAILSMALARGDYQMVGLQYAPDATLTTPGGVTPGRDRIVRLLANLRGLTLFHRVSIATKIVDSTVVDSGTYTMVIKKTAADSSVERGSYSAIWRIHPQPMEWVMTTDHLYPVPRKSTK
jgi:hypothetical protein